MRLNPKFDQYGYALNDIVWGNYPMGTSIYQSEWAFFISFIEKDTKKIILLNITRFLNQQECKYPRKLKKELLSSMKGQDISICLQILAERFPNAIDYILKRLPKTLLEKTNLEQTLLTSNTTTIQ